MYTDIVGMEEDAALRHRGGGRIWEEIGKGNYTELCV